LIDGAPARACLALAVVLSGREITTIEGLGTGDALGPVQQAFVEAGAIQCGFCMPGMIIQATALLHENPAPTVDDIRHAISGNLCRCSGYLKVIEAIGVAARRGAA
jgi:carbon-monoxide dehydrogenase small subunit